MQKHLFSHIRDGNGHIVATMAINGEGNVGIMIRNAQDSLKRKTALHAASIRADRGIFTAIPDRWITPDFFTKNRKNSSNPFTDCLAIRLSTVVEQEWRNLQDRAKRYFK